MKLKNLEDKKLRRVSVALTIEAYDGVKALAALTGTNFTDYIFRLVDTEVKANATAIQQFLLAQKSFEESKQKATDTTKKAAE